jgi:hypothetical protein
MAEQFRRTNCEVYLINGRTSERMNSNPINATQTTLVVTLHPDSNQLAEGWVFSDGSEIWEISNNGIYTIYTSK